MERRMTRHIKSDEQAPIRKTRMGKNRYLYDEINNKIGYEEIVSLDAQTGIDLNSIREGTTSREEYQKVKEYQSVLGMDTKEEIPVEYQEQEKKIYNINSVLEEAKKNRVKYDELEKKRKLKDSTYATLADLNKKHFERKADINKDIDEKELTDLINTITSHNLLNDIKEAEKQEEDNAQDILSDLLATNIDLNLEDGIANEYASNKESNKIINSFYTQSMDLSDQDFEFSEEFEKERKTKIKILIAVVSVIIVGVIGVLVFLLLKHKGLI